MKDNLYKELARKIIDGISIYDKNAPTAAQIEALAGAEFTGQENAPRLPRRLAEVQQLLRALGAALPPERINWWNRLCRGQLLALAKQARRDEEDERQCEEERRTSLQRTVRFEYRFHPVGQGLFVSGDLHVGIETAKEQWSRIPFVWVSDCGSDEPTVAVREAELFVDRMRHKQRIGLITLSHFDKDHINAVRVLASRRGVDRLVLPYARLADRLALVLDLEPDDPDGLDYILNPSGWWLQQLGDRVRQVINVVGGGDPAQRVPNPEKRQQSKTHHDDVVIPVQDEVPDDDNLVDEIDRESQQAARSGAVQFVNHRYPAECLGVWEFVFYNTPRPNLPFDFDNMINGLVRKYWKPGQRISKSNELLIELQRLYAARFGKSSKAKNNISLVTYSGLAFDRLIEPGFLSGSGFPSCYPPSRSGLTDHSPPVVRARSPLAMLHTGDITMNRTNLTCLKRHLGEDRWKGVSVYQVPHHGAKSSWDPSTRDEYKHLWSVFSAGRLSKYRHPHRKVVKGLSEHWPVFVNEFQSAAWDGHAELRIPKGKQISREAWRWKL